MLGQELNLELILARSFITGGDLVYAYEEVVLVDFISFLWGGYARNFVDSGAIPSISISYIILEFLLGILIKILGICQQEKGEISSFGSSL